MSLFPLYTVPYHSSLWSSLSQFESLLDESYAFSPRFEVSQEDDENGYILTLELPGFKREEITVEVDRGNVLTVKASRAGRRGQKQVIDRSITLGDDIDSSSITVKLENGILSVAVRKQPIPKARQIQIA